MQLLIHLPHFVVTVDLALYINRAIPVFVDRHQRADGRAALLLANQLTACGKESWYSRH